MSEKELVKEIWAHRDDPEEWSEEAEDIRVQPSRSSVVSFRLPREELTEIEQVRAQTGESLSEFIRGALALRLRGNLVGSTTGFIYGDMGIPFAEPDELVTQGKLVMGHCRFASSRKLKLEDAATRPFRWFDACGPQQALFSSNTV